MAVTLPTEMYKKKDILHRGEKLYWTPAGKEKLIKWPERIPFLQKIKLEVNGVKIKKIKGFLETNSSLFLRQHTQLAI